MKHTKLFLVSLVSICASSFAMERDNPLTIKHEPFPSCMQNPFMGGLADCIRIAQMLSDILPQDKMLCDDETIIACEQTTCELANTVSILCRAAGVVCCATQKAFTNNHCHRD